MLNYHYATLLHKSIIFLSLQDQYKFVIKRTLNIAFVFLLASNLLFNQVGLNFFHNKHEFQQKQSDQTQFHKHRDQCKVCALDTLFNLFLCPSINFGFYQSNEILLAFYDVDAKFVVILFSQDRAPPGSFS